MVSHSRSASDLHLLRSQLPCTRSASALCQLRSILQCIWFIIVCQRTLTMLFRLGLSCRAGTPFALFLVQVVFIIALARLLGFFLKYLKQPAVGASLPFLLTALCAHYQDPSDCPACHKHRRQRAAEQDGSAHRDASAGHHDDGHLRSSNPRSSYSLVARRLLLQWRRCCRASSSARQC